MTCPQQATVDQTHLPRHSHSVSNDLVDRSKWQWLERMQETDPDRARMIRARVIEHSQQRLKRHKIVEKLYVEYKMGPVEIHHEMRRMVEEKLKGWQACISDPGTLNVWSPWVLRKDIDNLRKVWERVVEKSVVSHRSAIVHELEAVKKKSWEDNNLKGVVSAIDRQIEVLGLKQPERVEIKHGLMDEWAKKLEVAKKRIAEEDQGKVVEAEIVK